MQKIVASSLAMLLVTGGIVITRIIIPFEGFQGRYVWHCHILEHEDNAMMRPYEVIAGG